MLQIPLDYCLHAQVQFHHFFLIIQIYFEIIKLNDMASLS